MLSGTDSFELIEIHDEVVSERHLLVELVAKVQMVKIILSQLQRQQAAHKGGLSASLIAYKRRHTFVSVQHIHLQPVSYGRSEPDGEIVQLFRADTWDTAEDLCNVVLSVPFG